MQPKKAAPPQRKQQTVVYEKKQEVKPANQKPKDELVFNDKFYYLHPKEVIGFQLYINNVANKTAETVSAWRSKHTTNIYFVRYYNNELYLTKTQQIRAAYIHENYNREDSITAAVQHTFATILNINNDVSAERNNMLNNLARHFYQAALPQFVYAMIDKRCKQHLPLMTNQLILDEPPHAVKYPEPHAAEIVAFQEQSDNWEILNLFAIMAENDNQEEEHDLYGDPIEPIIIVPEEPVLIPNIVIRQVIPEVDIVATPQSSFIKFNFKTPEFNILEKDGKKIFVNGPVQKHIEQCGFRGPKIKYGYNIHPHPCAHVERDLAEFTAKQILQARGCTSILDIGGNAKRQKQHSEFFKMHTHSCCPVLTTDDVFRQQARENAKLTNYCNHKMQDCDCAITDGLLLTQSLYYISPVDLGYKMLHSNTKCTIATIHEFDGIRGNMYQYKVGGKDVTEASWTRAGDNITMYVNGNQRPYIHKACDWLHQESVYIGNGEYLIWSKLQQFGQTAIYQFTTTRQPKTNAPISISSINALINLQSSIVTEVKEVNSKTTQDFALIRPNTKIIKSIFGISIINKDSDQSVYLPIDGVRQLCRFMTFKERTPATFTILVNQAKMMINDVNMKNLDSATKQDFVMFAPEIAFNNNLAIEINQLKAVFGFKQVHQKLNEALKGEVGESMKEKLLQFVNSYIGDELQVNEMDRRNFHQDDKYRQNIGMLTNAIRSMSSSEAYQLVPEMSQILSSTANDCNLNGYKYCQVDEFKPISALNDGDLKKLASDALLQKIETLKIINKDKPTLNATVIGIISGYCAAVIPARDRINTLHTVQQKVLCQIPTPNMTELAQFNLWVDIHYNQLFDNADLYDSTKIQPYTVDEWISSFPGGKKIRLNRIKDEIVYNGNFTVQQLVKDCMRTVFCKSEPLSKRGSKFTARPVQSVGDMANIILGPWMRKFTHVLKQKLWHKDWQITYSCGMTATEIGEWYQKNVVKHVVNGTRVIFEDDFSAYDSTQNTGLLAIEQKIYKRLGVSPCKSLKIGELELNGLTYNAAELVLAQQTTTIGTTKFGDQYGRTGMRKSGDPNTSCGNTIINGLAHYYCFHKEISRMNKWDIFDYNNNPLSMDIDLLLLGDDNLGSIDNCLVDYVADRLPVDMLKLGLKTKASTKTDIFNAEYCSGRVYQIGEDKWMYGPKWGRMLTRQGISMNQFKNQQTKKDWAIANMYSLRYTSWFIPGVEQWAIGHMKAFGASDKWIDGKISSQTMATVAASSITNSSQQANFVFKNIADSEEPIVYNMLPNQYCLNQFQHIYGFKSDDLIIELAKIFYQTKHLLNNGHGVAVWNPIFETMIRVDCATQISEIEPNSDGVLEQDHFVQNDFQDNDVRKLNKEFIETFMQESLNVIKERVIDKEQRRVYLQNATYLHPDINPTNCHYGMSSNAAVQW